VSNTLEERMGVVEKRLGIAEKKEYAVVGRFFNVEGVVKDNKTHPYLMTLRLSGTTSFVHIRLSKLEMDIFEEMTEGLGL